jgi:hypothetical protein
MSGLISIFGKSLKGLGKSPVLFIMGVALGILSIPALIGYGQFDDNVNLVAMIYTAFLLPVLILPFFTGGSLGYAVEMKKKGVSGMSTFISSAAKNYPKMFMAGLIAFIIYYILNISQYPLGDGYIDPMVGSFFGVLIMIVMFFVLMAIEFYDIGIIADGLGVVASFRNSIDFVRRNLATVILFFIALLVLKYLVQIPISFGMAGSIMSSSAYNSTVAGLNSSFNYTALNTTALVNLMTTVKMSLPVLIAVGIFQAVIEGFVFAFLALFKTEFYLDMKEGKNITDFDYQFPVEGGSNQFPKIKI